MIVKLLGILGGLAFAYCGIPAAWATIRNGRSVGTPASVAWMISAGSILMYSYLTLQHGFDLILTVNYGVEFLSWASIVYVHYFPWKTALEATIADPLDRAKAKVDQEQADLAGSDRDVPPYGL